LWVLSSLTISTGDGVVSGRPVRGEVGTGVGLGEGVAEGVIDATGALGLGTAVGSVEVEALHAATRLSSATAGMSRRAFT
jgi:hypothetical protein